MKFIILEISIMRVTLKFTLLFWLRDEMFIYNEGA